MAVDPQTEPRDVVTDDFGGPRVPRGTGRVTAGGAGPTTGDHGPGALPGEPLRVRAEDLTEDPHAASG